MKTTFIRLGCILVLTIFVIGTQAQTKSNTQKKKSTNSSKEIPPPPPPKKTEEAPAEVGIGGNDEAAPDKPVLNVDTSAVVKDSFTADILRLMNLTGAMNIGIMMAKGIEDKKTSEKVPLMKEFYTRFYDEMEHGAINRLLVNHFVKIYRKHFTQEEINSLIAFYQTDLGKKSISVLPQITQESMEFGRRLGEYYGQKIMYELMLEEQKKSN